MHRYDYVEEVKEFVRDYCVKLGREDLIPASFETAEKMGWVGARPHTIAVVSIAKSDTTIPFSEFKRLSKITRKIFNMWFKK